MGELFEHRHHQPGQGTGRPFAPAPLSVSTIIPAFNRAVLLREAVLSVLSQTCAPMEIIIVDDGSRDNTTEVVATLAGPVHYFRKPNGGPASARNLGIQVSRGEFIAFLDSDDRWHPDKLQRQVAYLARNPDVGLVHTAAELLDEHGRPTGEVWGSPECTGDVSRRLRLSNGLTASSVVVRRSLLTRAGGYDEAFRCLENWDLWIRLSRMTRFGYLAQPLTQYRVHPGNLIRNLEGVQEAYLRVLEKCAADSPHRTHQGLEELALARYHRAIADALVRDRHWSRAQRHFIASLLLQPWQGGVYWKMIRVASAMGRDVVSTLARMISGS